MDPLSDPKQLIRMRKPLLVLSGINLTDTGKLSILTDCLDYADTHLSQEFDVLALVPGNHSFPHRNIRFRTFPLSKKSWWFRLYYEYIFFYFLSRKLKPYLWLSLHDMTPNVQANVRAVYCHNAAPFYKIPSKYLFHDRTFTMFNWFYDYLYGLNIRKNQYVVVQQHWLADVFRKRYRIDTLLVARPASEASVAFPPLALRPASGEPTRFFYPSYPRFHKNAELACEAGRLLRQKGITGFEIAFTFDGSENRYAREMVEQYGHDPGVQFLGLLPREEVFARYASCDYLLFPSQLESWGLPLSEVQPFGKPVLAADLPYAYETIGTYPYAAFFNPDSVEELANLMEAAIHRTLSLAPSPSEKIPSGRAAAGWRGLFDQLLCESSSTASATPPRTPVPDATMAN